MKRNLLMLFLVAMLLPLFWACTPLDFGDTPTTDPTPTQEVWTPTPLPTEEPTPDPVDDVFDVDRMRFSYNVNCDAIPDVNYLITHLQTLNPTYVLCMGNIELAKRLARELPNTRVIYRDWSRREGDEWKDKSPQEFVDKWRSYNAPELIYYTTNEPSFGENFSQLDEFVEHQVETMRLARQHGLTIAAGNLATGVIRPEWITDGIFDPYLAAIRDYGHFHAAHEYTILTLPFGVGQWPLSCLQEPECVQPDNWPTRGQVPLDYWEIDAASAQLFPPFWSEDTEMPYGEVMLRSALDLWTPQDIIEYEGEPIPRSYGNMPSSQSVRQILPPYWHLRRNDWFILRAANLPPEHGESFHLRVLLTEWQLDNMDDVKPSVHNLRLEYGMPEYNHDFRGLNTVGKIYKEFYYPQWSEPEAHFRQVQWADYIYPSNYEGFLTFTWSLNPLWRQADISGGQRVVWFRYHDMLEEYAFMQYNRFEGIDN